MGETAQKPSVSEKPDRATVYLTAIALVLLTLLGIVCLMPAMHDKPSTQGQQQPGR